MEEVYVPKQRPSGEESFSPRRTTDESLDPWENVPPPQAAEPLDPRDNGAAPTAADQRKSQLRRLGSTDVLRVRSSTVQVIYKLEIPLGKEETFLAAFWKHESQLRRYAIEVSICRSADTQRRARKNLATNFSGGANDNNAGTPSPPPSVPVAEDELSHACKVCHGEGRADPCTEYIAGPLRRVKEGGPTNSEDLSQSDGSNAPSLASSSVSLSNSKDTAATGGIGGGGGGATVSASPSHFHQSPFGRKPARSQSGVFWASRISRFVERRCRTCGHLALDHTTEGKTATYMLYLEFKTRAAWESAFAHSEDVASDAMKNCIARFYEPSIMQILDEQVPEEPDYDEQYGSSMDEDLSAATESIDEVSANKQREVFRLSVWKAQNLPRRSDGSPHTWVVQAKFGKSVLTSSAKKTNDPVWREHFHFHYKAGRKVFMRIIATDEPRECTGKLRINLKDTGSRSRSHSQHSHSLGRKAGRASIDRRNSEQSGLSTTGAVDDEFEESTANAAIDDLWQTARQWRDIEPKEKGQKHGQMLLSLELDVPLVDPLALHRPVKDDEPEGVAEVLPPGCAWGLFAEMVGSLQTGDVMLFVGHGWVGSTVQKYEERTWIHVGMVMVFPEYDMTLLWELTPSKSIEVSNKRTGQLKLNVQLTDINSKLRDGRYYRVAVRRLECERTQERVQNVMQLKKQLETQGYSRFLDHFLEETQLANEDLSAFFSAELLASAYKAMGLISADDPLSLYGPKFWLQEGTVAFQGGATLGPCVLVERNFEPLSKTYIVKERTT